MTPLRPSRKGPLIPGLAFADNCIFFLQTTPTFVAHFHQLVTTFGLFSGQTVNKDKPIVTLGPSTPCAIKQATLRPLGLHGSHGQDKYLGLPLVTVRVMRQMFSELIENLGHRLHLWSNNFLSYAGRTTLINAVCTSLPSYYMFGYSIPPHILTILSNKIKSFFWNATKLSHKTTTVPWATITLRKQYGGLGIKNLHSLNKTYMIKLLWKLFT